MVEGKEISNLYIGGVTKLCGNFFEKYEKFFLITVPKKETKITITIGVT